MAVLRFSLVQEVYGRGLCLFFLKHFLFKVKIQWPCTSFVDCDTVFAQCHFKCLSV